MQKTLYEKIEVKEVSNTCPSCDSKLSSEYINRDGNPQRSCKNCRKTFVKSEMSK